MSRPPRLDPPDGHHHVYNRGARKANIFLDDEDCLSFCALLAELPTRYGVEVHGYALMSNHFHLMVVSRRGRLGQAMQRLQGEHAARFNQRHATSGPLYEGRYASRLVEDDVWWAHLLAYVHLNPVAAHLVGDPAEAYWTSHAAYLGRESRPPWLFCDELLATFGGAKALDAYVREVQIGREQGPEGFVAELWEGGPSGGDRRAPAPPPRPPTGLLSPEDALIEVAAVTGLPVAELRLAHPGRTGSPARWVALAWLVERAGLTQAEAGRRLGANPVVVCRDLAKVRRLQSGDSPVGRWIRHLREIRNG